MVSASVISRLSQAVDQIEKRLKRNRPWKVVQVRCSYHEDRDAACDRHFAAHPEDRDANIVILKFYDEKMAVEGQDGTASAGPAGDAPHVPTDLRQRTAGEARAVPVGARARRRAPGR